MDNYYHTGRLTLRTLSADYAGVVLNFLYDNRQYFEPFESKKPDNFYTEVFQYDTLLAESSFLENNYFIRYYVFLENVQSPIGTISFKRIPSASPVTMTLGYKFDHRFWGCGYAYESISYIIKLLQENGIADNFEAIVQPDNIRSVSLLMRLGFTHSFGKTQAHELPQGTVIHHIYHLSGLTES